MAIQNAEEITPDPLSRIHERKQAEGHFDLYANNAQVVTSYFDFQLSFGEVLEASKEKLVTEDMITIKMSPQLAKRLRDILGEQVSQYEGKYGVIPTAPPISKPDKDNKKE